MNTWYSPTLLFALGELLDYGSPILKPATSISRQYFLAVSSRHPSNGFIDNIYHHPPPTSFPFAFYFNKKLRAGLLSVEGVDRVDEGSISPVNVRRPLKAFLLALNLLDSRIPPLMTAKGSRAGRSQPAMRRATMQWICT